MKSNRVRPQDQRLEQNLLMHMIHEMLVHMIYFLFQRNFRVLFANSGNIKHFITYGNISSNNIREKKYNIVNHTQEKRKIIILWIPRSSGHRKISCTKLLHLSLVSCLHICLFLGESIIPPFLKLGRLRK
jgi:hypothetical protein